MRRPLALLAAAAVAAIAALILGEYQLTLWTGTAAGLVLGFLLIALVFVAPGGLARALSTVVSAVRALFPAVQGIRR